MGDPRVGTMIGKLEEAQARLIQAQNKVNAARIEETNALNALNEIQKGVDVELARLKKESPTESDWGRERRERT